MTVERLYTPWRMKYVTSNKKKPKSDSIFTDILAADPSRDRENFLLYRGRYTFTVMNIYPYNPGHLLILPNEQVSTLSETSLEAQYEMMRLATYYTEILGEVLNPDGFNVGINIGKPAGAGINGHLHMHVVPRWTGDSNFMPTISNTRILPEELPATYDKIQAAIKQNPPPVA